MNMQTNEAEIIFVISHLIVTRTKNIRAIFEFAFNPYHSFIANTLRNIRAMKCRANQTCITNMAIS